MIMLLSVLVLRGAFALPRAFRLALWLNTAVTALLIVATRNH
jgi:hypothetical protein